MYSQSQSIVRYYQCGFLVLIWIWSQCAYPKELKATGKRCIKDGLCHLIIITGLQVRAVPWKCTSSGGHISAIFTHRLPLGDCGESYLAKIFALYRIIPVTWYGDVILQKRDRRNPLDTRLADSKMTSSLFLFNYY